MTTAAEPLYSIRTPYPDVLTVDRDNEVAWALYRDGEVVAPDSATWSLLAPDGTEVASDASVSPGADGVCRITITAATLPSATIAKGEGYQQVFTPTIDGKVYGPFDRETAVSLRPLYPVITDADLLDEFPTLAQHRGSSATSFQQWIDAAWKRIIGRLIAEGHMAYLIKSSWAFRLAHLELARALFERHVTRQLKRTGSPEDDEKLFGPYEAAWSQISFAVDGDHDGRVDDTTKRESPGAAMVHRNQSPKGFRGRRRDARW